MNVCCCTSSISEAALYKYLLSASRKTSQMSLITVVYTTGVKYLHQRSSNKKHFVNQWPVMLMSVNFIYINDSSSNSKNTHQYNTVQYTLPCGTASKHLNQHLSKQDPTKRESYKLHECRIYYMTVLLDCISFSCTQ